jgi:hypothetical protein
MKKKNIPFLSVLRSYNRKEPHHFDVPKDEASRDVVLASAPTTPAPNRYST